MSTKPMTAHTLRVAHLDRELSTHAGESIYHSARRQGVRIVRACGGPLPWGAF